MDMAEFLLAFGDVSWPADATLLSDLFYILVAIRNKAIGAA